MVRKALIVVAALLLVQILLVFVYLGIERDRDDDVVSVERLSRPAPDLVLLSPDGMESRLSDRRGSTVVLHFWATWCPPCREELPSLLAFASAADADVLAVSVDPEWAAVRSFVGEKLDHVYRASSDSVFDIFGVDELPQTLVIDASGTLRLHFRGPQDWGSPVIRAVVTEATEHDDELGASSGPEISGRDRQAQHAPRDSTCERC